MKQASILQTCLAVCWLIPFASQVHATGDQAKTDAVSPLRAAARDAATKGDTGEAIQRYREAIQKTPANLGLYLEFSEYLASAGQYPEAIGMYERCLRLASKKEEAELGLAEAYRRVHNMDAARAVLQSARKHHPRSVRVLKALGSFELEAESNDAAIEALRAAATITPGDTNVQILLATAYLERGEKEAALAELRRMLVQKPDDPAGLFERGQIYADRDQNELALADMERVFALQPKNAKARNLLAKILIRLHQCERAADLLKPEQNVSLDTEGLFLLSNAYECAGQADAATRAREEFAAASENERRQAENEVQSKHLYERANEFARQNKFSEALDLLHQALEKNPQNGFAYSQQAKIFFSMHDPERAQAAISKALVLQPFQPDFLYVAGVIAENDNRQEEAIAAFEQVTEINPKEADAYFEMGRIFMKRNDRDRALAAFREALKLEPDDPDYRRALDTASSCPSPRH